MALHNWEIAAASGGRFVLIADDYAYNLQCLQEQSLPLMESVRRYCEDLEWLGLRPDEVVYSIDNAEAHYAAAERLGLLPLPGRVGDLSMGVTSIRNRHNGQADGYVPFLVAVRVVDDAALGIDGFCRGADLIGERQLYDYVCRQLRHVPPWQEYLPVIQRENAPGKESKSLGAVSVRQLRAAGYTPRQVLDTLRECDRRSRAAGLAATIIPADVLDIPEIGTLTFVNPRLTGRYNESYAGEEFGPAVRYWWQRMESRLRRRRA